MYERVCMKYEKQSRQHGVLYLHGWEFPFKGYAYVRWFNACLRLYDEPLPELKVGDLVWIEGKLSEPAGPFVDVLVLGPLLVCSY